MTEQAIIAQTLKQDGPVKASGTWMHVADSGRNLQDPLYTSVTHENMNRIYEDCDPGSLRHPYLACGCTGSGLHQACQDRGGVNAAMSAGKAHQALQRKR